MTDFLLTLLGIVFAMGILGAIAYTIRPPMTTLNATEPRRDHDPAVVRGGQSVCRRCHAWRSKYDGLWYRRGHVETRCTG